MEMLDSGAIWFWAAYVGCGVLLVTAAYLGGRRRRLRVKELARPRDPAEPLLCMNCGYDVRGLDGQICPECGTNLEATGLATAQFRRWNRLPSVARLLVWTVCVAVVGGLCLLIAMIDYVPFVETVRMTYRISADRRAMPAEYDQRLRDLFGEDAEQRYYEGVHATITADFEHQFRAGNAFSRGLGGDESDGSSFFWESGTVELVRNELIPLEAVTNTRWPTLASVLVTSTLIPGQTPDTATRDAESDSKPLEKHFKEIVAVAEISEEEAERTSERLHRVLVAPREAQTALLATDGGFAASTNATVVAGPVIHRPTLIAAIALWPIAWLIGLPLVLRRRAVRGVSGVAGAAASTSPGQGAEPFHQERTAS